MGGLVQQPAAPGAHRQHPAGRSRGALLRHTGKASHGGVTQTKRPPANPGRFNGAFADGSGWKPVADILQSHGYSVLVVQEPEASFAADVAATRRVLDKAGPC